MLQRARAKKARNLLVGDGHHIQDIGWIVGGALYWVSNSILDDLSNEQMFAIAESAQALR